MSKSQVIFIFALFTIAIFVGVHISQLEQKVTKLEARQSIIDLNVETTENLVKIVKLMDERIEKLEYVQPVEQRKPATTDRSCVVIDMNPPTWSCAPPNLTPDNSILRQGLFQWELSPPEPLPNFHPVEKEIRFRLPKLNPKLQSLMEYPNGVNQ